MLNKTPHDVLGVKKRCINYIKCPLCYGCRNYRGIDPSCAECARNKKDNICNTDKHKPDLIAQFITKDRIKITKQVEFKSAK
jgi:hypothetical protein